MSSESPFITCEEMVESGIRQRRWLSLPQSRLIVNPYDFHAGVTPYQYSVNPTLPLNIGYYVNRKSPELPERLMIFERLPDTHGSLATTWEENFIDFTWDVEPGLKAEPQQGRVVLTVDGTVDPYGAITRWMDIDIDESPWIEITIPRAVGAWGLKVSEDGRKDTTLQGDTRKSGTYLYNIAHATGWTGKRRVQLKVFAIMPNEPVDVTRLRLMGVDAHRQPAREVESRWAPDKLTHNASYSSGTMPAFDYFHDENTVVRCIMPGAELALSIGGRYEGAPSWNADEQVLLVEAEDYFYALAFPQKPLHLPQYFPSLVALQADKESMPEPPPIGYWNLDLPLVARNALPFAIAFATREEGASFARSRAKAGVANWEKSSFQRRMEWDTFLAGIPHPTSFDVAGVTTHGVTAEDIRHDYYAAWVFTRMNSLPAMPESGFSYPQQPTGKPSLWMEGAPAAAASASWESFFAIQYTAYFDPDLAWDCYRGLMSLVDEQGVLGGESLPSRKAQTAWILYELTGDKRGLRDTYDALKRYLLWRRDNPRWIHKEHGYPWQRDSDFVVSAIVDMDFARKIAGELNMPDEAALWRQERAALLDNYKRWFWETPPGEFSYQIYDVNADRRGWGNSQWVAQGLILHRDLGPEYLRGLMGRFHHHYNPDQTFGGFAVAKYPETDFIVQGLYEMGEHEHAAAYANVTLRDVVDSRMFAEIYSMDRPPVGAGVRPSYFGVANVIDMIWLKNGYVGDFGTPHLARLPNEIGGLRGLSIRGKALNIELLRENTVRIQGSYVKELLGQEEATVPLGAGEYYVLGR